MDLQTLGVLAAVGIRTGLVLIVLIAGIRAFGKRHLGELNVQDILMVLMMANAVQNSMTTGNGSLSVALVSASALILMGWMIGRLVTGQPSLEKGLLGSPVVIVHDGRILQRNLRREKLTENEVLAAVRKQGISGLDDVRLIVLEVDGSLSVVPKDDPNEPESDE